LPWDSEFFGCRVARVTADNLSEGSLPVIFEWCWRHAIRCLYLLSATDDDRTARLAQGHGFVRVDERVTLVRPAGKAVEQGPGGSPGCVRPCRAPDIPALAAIAGVSHVDSRFFADPHFSRPRCAALYETWITQDCRGGADVVLVAQWQGQPAGYISCRRLAEGVGQIGLFGVSAAARGRGLGRQLLHGALSWFGEHDLHEIQVVTQGRNEAARRTYARAGFEVRTTQFWYHRWFAAPGARAA
jgi:dTDP-4-amino-4,6-dideoxy-D-galactose acyltransferase